MRKLGRALVATVFFVPGMAQAAETIMYSYDALGRVVAVQRVGNPASAGGTVSTTYSHDRADNRTSKNTSGSANSGPP